MLNTVNNKIIYIATNSNKKGLSCEPIINCKKIGNPVNRLELEAKHVIIYLGGGGGRGVLGNGMVVVVGGGYCGGDRTYKHIK